MEKKQSSRDSSSDRRQWQRIFGALVEMLQSQQSLIETLKSDRELLERYVHIQHDRWAAKARLLELHIAQTKMDEKKSRRVQAAKLDLMVGMKQREALRYKKQAEFAESDLEDFRACVEALNAEISALKENLQVRQVDKGRSGVSELKPTENSNDGEKSAVALKGELQKLKHAYKKLSSKKDAEVSALLAEKDFVWNQLKKMEGDYTAILKNMRVEVEQANETIDKLQGNLESLQSSANEKNEKIAKLEAERVRLELDLRSLTEEAKEANGTIEKLQLDMDKLCSSAKEKDETIAKLRSDLVNIDATITNQKSRFYREMSSQRSSRGASVTPVGRRPTRSSRKRGSESAERSESQKNRRSQEGSSGLQTSASDNRLQRCSTRKRTRINSSVDSPKLFSANFKVPKLRSLSSAIV